jgi:hypothetical protein
MLAIARLLMWGLFDCFKSCGGLEVEVAVLRHRLNILYRKAPVRVRLEGLDRVIFVWLYRHFPDVANAVTIAQPETVVRRHRMGFRAWWCWKSRPRGDRPKIDRELRDFIICLGEENPLWGVPCINGELLKLGFTIA